MPKPIFAFSVLRRVELQQVYYDLSPLLTVSSVVFKVCILAAQVILFWLETIFHACGCAGVVAHQIVITVLIFLLDTLGNFVYRVDRLSFDFFSVGAFHFYQKSKHKLLDTC